jgi:diguanylate cyclase (GGDEF)-like protein/PAS domain S-box-containing protein
VAEQVPLAVCSCKLDGIVATASPAARALLGVTDGEQFPLARFFSDRAVFDRFWSAVRGSGNSTIRTLIQPLHGTPIPAEIVGLRDLSGDVLVILRRRDGGASGSDLLVPVDSLINNTPAVAIQIYGRDGRVRIWNPAAEALYGFTAAEIVGRRMQDTIITPADFATFEQEIARICATGEPSRPAEWRVHHKDGSERHVYSTMFPIDIDGERLVCCMDVDVTERRRAEEALRASEARFRALVEHSYDGIALIDREGYILYAGPSTERLIGHADRQVLGQKIIEYVFEEDRDRLRRTFATLIATPGESVVTQYRVAHADGAVRWMEGVMTNLLQQAAVGAVVANYRDITERKESEIQMAYQAYHDALTDLPNRMLFANRLAMALAHARRVGEQLGVLFLDLDQFKLINDTLGHTVGDRLLQAVARRLQSAVRTEDSLARVGGDEFTLFLQECRSTQEAVIVAEKLIALLDEPFVVDGHQLYVSASIGISFFPADGETAESLIKAADTAMYRAKELGRHGVYLFTPEINDRYRERLQMETSLRHALEEQQFVLHYQPLYDRVTEQVLAVEALVRWQHPTRGLVPPAEFIPLAEDTRMILPLGEWVLRTACTDVMNWRSTHLPTLRLTVNLSARQFQHGDLLATIDRILGETGFDPEALELEITETIAMENAELTLKTLRELKRRKITIAVDDFGTGQTSLTYLTRFPIDTVKIDREFVRNLGNDSSDAAIVSAVIALSQRLRMKVVAEGVETEEQLRFLGEQGCDQIQGFLFSRPLAPIDLGNLLRSAD